MSKTWYRKSAKAGCEIRGFILTDIIIHKENLALVSTRTWRQFVDVDQGGWGLVFESDVKRPDFNTTC